MSIDNLIYMIFLLIEKQHMLLKKIQPSYSYLPCVIVRIPACKFVQHILINCSFLATEGPRADKKHGK